MLDGTPSTLFGWSAQTWLILDQVGILCAAITVVLSWTGLVLAWLKKDSIRRWLTSNRFPTVGGFPHDVNPWQALIFTVSREEVPTWVMKTIRPSMVGLVASQESKKVSETLDEFARQLSVQSVETVVLDDPDDPAGARMRTRYLIELMRAHGAVSIAVDVTGGKTPTSLGAFMAAEEAEVDTIYVTSRFDDQLRKPDMSTAQIVCISRPA
ncbi:MAG: hypothetical protein ACREA0_26585 [bacterium]